MNLTDRILTIHHALASGAVPHAFGGALALAWCTARPRGTVNIGFNVFVRKADALSVLGALPREIVVGPTAHRTIAREGQARLRWDATPVDLFFSTTPFHDEVAQRVRHERFGGSLVPFLACVDLAVFKAFFNRLQDWADLERMVAVRAFDIETAAGTLARYVAAADPSVIRLRGF